MRYSVARNPLRASMAPADPKIAAKPAPAAQAPQPQPEPEMELTPDEIGPQIERVNMAGLVLEKTVFSDGMCKTEVLREPEIDPSLVRATRNSQRARGH